MPWIKDATTDKPRIIYTAPATAHPIIKVIHDPRAGRPKWMVEYAWLNQANDSLAAIEAIMAGDGGLL